jgi:uncharacterized membrane protein YeaQ/YmgE (transglycosylase-associated protein family)
MPGRDPGGCIITILLGIAGAFVAGYLGRLLHWYEPGEPAGFIASVIGAMLLLLIYRLVIGKRGKRLTQRNEICPSRWPRREFWSD